MSSNSYGAFLARTIKWFAILGLVVGILLFIVTQLGFSFPIVVGTTSYEGITASLFLLIGSPIVLIVLGFIVSLFTYSSSKRSM
ncbi:hypothetical protein NQ117_07105 [Paenibacillus sp. SC116]|uniref:hypothetical protein n=1 Tax=Paenibacillus sp. SC116 TaxID=2968986 RepID=UPI00215AD5FB|nr:hypothetical protein [Paenibacillus sp. SC116]MCR8843447.1 hypothetical protein [Paenibacillus sp. SC116]